MGCGDMQFAVQGLQRNPKFVSVSNSCPRSSTYNRIRHNPYSRQLELQVEIVG